jgi:hypothetical protein
MSRNLEEDAQSLKNQERANTIREDEEQTPKERVDEGENEDLVRKEIAKALVNQIINKIQTDFIQESEKKIKCSSMESSKTLEFEEEVKIEAETCNNTNSNKIIKNSISDSNYSDSIYNDTKMAFSDAPSSTDEIYHDVETDINDLSINEEDLVKNLNELDLSNNNKANSGVVSPSSNDSSKLISSMSQSKSFMKKSLSNHDLVSNFALNMHRIDKDVTRCDRTYWYFTSNDNLKKLKNIMYT